METDKQFRAGKYIPQPTGYKAFIPQPLPPLNLDIDNEMLTLLSKADRALGRLDGATEILPNADLFVYMYVRKEAVLSSQIEGTQASLMDVLEYEAHAPNLNNLPDIAEVTNYVKALNYGLQRIADGFPLSLRLFREIHQRLLENVRGNERTPGEFRRTQNWIGTPGCSLDAASFVPPPPGSDMMNALGNVETFLHEDRSLPVLIKTALAHCQFETIHPFLDGNGRMGRLLITFYLCQQGILQKPLLYLSHYLKQHRSVYYERLQEVRDWGRWEEWIKFFLTGIQVVAEEATSTARQIVQLRETHRDLLIGSLGKGSARGLALLEFLYTQPVIDINIVSERLGISFSSANALVSRMEGAGILTEITGNRRNRRFLYPEYLHLFKGNK